MADDLVIRELRTGEVEALVDIALAAWVPVFASFRQILGDEIFEATRPDWRAEKARQVRAACAPESRAIVRVAELSGRAVGFVTAYTDVKPGIGEIGNNAVHPDFQGRGIAPRMYEHILAILRERGMRFVLVSTGLDPSHAPARRAYSKAGFSVGLPTITYYRKL